MWKTPNERVSKCGLELYWTGLKYFGWLFLPTVIKAYSGDAAYWNHFGAQILNHKILLHPRCCCLLQAVVKAPLTLGSRSNGNSHLLGLLSQVLPNAKLVLERAWFSRCLLVSDQSLVLWLVLVTLLCPTTTGCASFWSLQTPLILAPFSLFSGT